MIAQPDDPIEIGEVTELTRWAGQNHPLGQEPFDKAWSILHPQRSRDDVAACPKMRKLVRQLIDDVRTAYHNA